MSRVTVTHMSRSPLPAGIVAFILLTGAAGAQTPPDLSGTWTLPPDAALAPGGPLAPAPGYGPEINIQQTATTITISRMIGGAVVHVSHPLDGTESRAVTPGGLCRGDLQSLWTAGWEGTTLVIIMVGSLPAGATATSRTALRAAFRMPAPDTLLVDTPVRSSTGSSETRTTRYVRIGPPATVPAPTPQASVPGRATQLEWLAGTWVGTTGSSTSEERWSPPAGGSMLGIARTLRGGGLAAFEFLCITERNGGLVYQAMPNGRQPATDFTLTKIDARSMTFENPANSFPKSIRYSLLSDDTLEAVISGAGGQDARTFRFKKQ